MFLEAVFLCEEPWLSRTQSADSPASASWEQSTRAQKQLSKNLFWIFFQAKALNLHSASMAETYTSENTIPTQSW